MSDFQNHLPFLMEEARPSHPWTFWVVLLSWIRYPVTLLPLIVSKIAEEALPKKQSLLQFHFFVLKISVDALPQEMIITVALIFKPSLYFLGRFLKAYFATYLHHFKYIWYPKKHNLDQQVLSLLRVGGNFIPFEGNSWAFFSVCCGAHRAPSPPVLSVTGGNQPSGECHRNHGTHQWEDQQLCSAACLGPLPLCASSLHAAQWHRRPCRHGGILQLWKGGLGPWDPTGLKGLGVSVPLCDIVQLVNSFLTTSLRDFFSLPLSLWVGKWN